MKSKTVKVPAVAFIKDHGDGGGSTTIYPNLGALRKDRFPRTDFGTEEEYDKKWQEVLDEDDTYQNGEIDKDAGFEIQINEDGTVELVGVIYASWGQ